jgi:hypothetical protein
MVEQGIIPKLNGKQEAKPRMLYDFDFEDEN